MVARSASLAMARIERAMDVFDSMVLVASEAQMPMSLRSSSIWRMGLAAAMDRAEAERSRAMVRVAGFESKTRLGRMMVHATSQKWTVPGCVRTRKEQVRPGWRHSRPDWRLAWLLFSHHWLPVLLHFYKNNVPTNIKVLQHQCSSNTMHKTVQHIFSFAAIS
jgi:hypothetical protein